METAKTMRHLPHWTRDGAVYWITFRMADSVPIDTLNKWKWERRLWIDNHPKPWSPADWLEYNFLMEQLEAWVDKGFGSCALANPKVREKVLGCLLRFDNERLRVHSAVVMPNHVHVLLEPLAGNQLSKLLQGIKGASAKEANRFLGSEGKFWLEESYDRIVRSEQEYFHFVRYIADNPIKAKLPEGSHWLKEWDASIPMPSLGLGDG